MSSYPVRTVVIASLAGLVVSGAAIEGAPLVGPDLGLVIAVATAFGAGACAVLCDSDLRCCEPDGPFDASARLRTPWLTVAMTVACGFFVTVLYGVAEYMTWLYDWQPNYIAFGVAALAVMVSTAGVLLRTRSWMHTVWVPLFAVFTLAIVFSCLPTRAFVQVAVGFMMAAVFASHFLCWMVFPSLFSALKVPRAFAAGAVLVLTNSSLASLAGDALGSVLPRSMQNLGSVAGIMAIVVAVLFAVTFVLNRNRIGAVGVLGGDARQREGAGFALAGGVAPAMAEVAAGAADTFSVGADADDGSRLGGEAAEISQVWEPDAAEPEPPSLVDSLKSRLDDMGVQYGLTPRELEVAFYTVQGFSCAYIADKLVVSNSTVRFHQQNIYRKFDVHSRNELIEAVTVE